MSKSGFNAACRAVLALLPMIFASAGCAAIGPHAAAGRPFSVFATTHHSPAPTPRATLTTEGRHFVDASGRVVILRGVNLSGDAKVPPFLPSVDESDLDRIADLGFNAVRLLFIWEAYEPSPGSYDEDYLDRLRLIADRAWERGLYVVVDVHQDGFSRHASRGAGDGFPRWAVSPRGRASTPDNSSACKNWPVLMALDPTTHRSFDDFFADAHGVRSRYLLVLGRIAERFADAPSVVGYDFLNEPWGDERQDLAPLYRQAAQVVRARHPGALAFLEGHVTTNCGLATRLPRPDYDGVVYAPHYYRPLTVLLGRWHGTTVGMNRAFSAMNDTSESWDVPLFLGEFGVPALARNAADYMAAIYDRMDASLASGTQWNYSPQWTESAKDGWNGEDFSIIDSAGEPRANFLARPYPRCTAGAPIRFQFRAQGRDGGPEIEFVWANRPELGATEIHLPRRLFPGEVVVAASGPASFEHDEARQVLICRASESTTISIRLSAGSSEG
jgi:endoglycosylceramidase